MIDTAGAERLRRLAAQLQGESPGARTDHRRGQRESYDLGFEDGQIQAGNELEALLDDLSGVERRPDS